MKQINWGILGLGNIALKFAEAFKSVKNARLLSISSKDIHKLNYFKKNFKIENEYCFNRYEDLLKCSDLDIIYIALPNSLHFDWIVKCIENEKNILVEKPATIKSSEVAEIMSFIKDKNLFFSEAFMYLYHPQILKIINLINEKTIGKLVSMESFFGNDILTKRNIFGFKKKKKLDKDHRLFNKNLGGGAILDLGCYPVSFSTLLAKLTSNFDYQNIKVLNKKLDIGDTGVDIDSYAEIDFGNDFKSYIGASFSKNLGKSTKIKGTESNLIIEDTWQADSSCIRIIGKKNQEIKVNSYKNIYCNV